MCGIHLQVLLAKKSSNPNESCCCARSFRSLKANGNVIRRGPDHSQVIQMEYQGVEIFLQSSVLQMRHDLISQPRSIQKSDSASFLCWNGEVYQALDDTNDDNNDGDDGDNDHPNVVKHTNQLLHDVWQYDQSDTQYVAQLLSKGIENDINQRKTSSLLKTVTHTLSHLLNAEYAIVILTHEAIYFGRDPWGRRSLLRSDCDACGSFTICSVVADEQPSTCTTWMELPPGQITEYQFRSNTWQTMDLLIPNRPPCLPSLIGASLHPPPPPPGVSPDCWQASLWLEECLTRAVNMRLDHSGRRPTAVLFSGGLDSVVLAAIAIQQTNRKNNNQNPIIILSNVSFGPDYAKSADRQAALISYKVLQEKFPNQTIHYEDIVVDWEEMIVAEPHIRTLLYPKTTLMDVNIATALWFASRGKYKGDDADDDDGKNNNNSNSKHKDDQVHAWLPPRVLLLGMGADEQMGGYGRHRKAFQKHGEQGLLQELQLDQARLWERNLGRDDRICADHGKEARFPYLDVHVTNLLRSLPLEHVCDFSLPPGQGDKLILRLVAKRMGLDVASGLVKRAIQFGSRISHLSDVKRFGSRRKARGEADV